jgi:hypothetical protein
LAVAVGMTRQNRDLQLTEYDGEHWRATFVASETRSIIGGTAWETTSWRAVQRTAWVALGG